MVRDSENAVAKMNMPNRVMRQGAFPAMWAG